MKLSPIMKSPRFGNDELLEAEYAQLGKIVDNLRGKALPIHVTLQINDELACINYFTGSRKDLHSHLRKSKAKILKLLEKNLRLVPKNHYRNAWSFMGISFFGIPSVMTGLILGEAELIAAGIPLGICVGMVIGLLMDRKAVQNGYQLNV
jgi:hypothetical protein